MRLHEIPIDPKGCIILGGGGGGGNRVGSDRADGGGSTAPVW